MESRLLSQDALSKILDAISRPKAHGLTQQALERALVDFCAGCPDPVQARWLIVECADPMTDAALLRRALGAPLRPIGNVPTSVVPADHPARASLE